MGLHFCYSFPAMKGKQANRDFFVIMCPLKVLPKLFVFDEDELSVELKAQRTLNRNRIPEISEYILKNRNDYVFSSLTASIDGQYEFISSDQKGFESIGLLNISMDSKLLINDGQHRKYSIEEAIKADSTLAEETISIVMFIDEDLKRSQQIFSDLNKHAVNVSKSISITYDHRNPVAQLTKEIVMRNPYLHQYTDLEKSTLSKFSNKLFTISNIYNTNQKIIGNLQYEDQQSIDTLNSFILHFWEFLVENIYEWGLVFKKESSPYNLREDYIISYGTVLEALGLIAHELYKAGEIDIEKHFKNINQINWHRNNLADWKDRIIGTNGRILKSSQCIRLTAIKIKEKLQIPSTKTDEQLDRQFKEAH